MLFFETMALLELGVLDTMKVVEEATAMVHTMAVIEAADAMIVALLAATVAYSCPCRKTVFLAADLAVVLANSVVGDSYHYCLKFSLI